MMKAVELVFIPSLGIGQLVSTIEIAKILVARDDRLFITVLIMKLPLDSKGTGVHTDSVAAPSMSDRINFIDLPVPQQDMQPEGINPGIFLKSLVESYKPQVKDAVTKLIIESNRAESNRRLAGFVIDMFCTTMIDVANEFGVPTYIFFASNTGFLGLMFYLQTLHDEQNKDCTEFKDSGAELVLPSFVHTFPARFLPSLFLDKDRAAEFIDYARRYRETKGILINTFNELESHALHSLCDGKTPPLYPVGPVLNLMTDENHEASAQAKQKADILEWLDDQPPSSVVFLCFGSMGSFGEDQIKELAWGLERSGLRFLWSLRQPPPKGKFPYPGEYADPNQVLPEGFLDRTFGIGKVIGWAPQVVVLAHPAVGGFVSHCGWNSALESLWYGVPIAAWPMYAEQQVNAFMLVREFGLAVEIKMDYRKDSEMMVNAQEIERGIRKVMELDSDQRKKVMEMSEKSKKALMDSGSSHSLLGRFINQLFP